MMIHNPENRAVITVRSVSNGYIYHDENKNEDGVSFSFYGLVAMLADRLGVVDFSEETVELAIKSRDKSSSPHMENSLVR